MGMTSGIRRVVAGLVVTMAGLATGWTSAVVQAQVTGAATQQSAEFTRGELRQLMQKFPPALGRVLVLDPTLLTNEDYLKSYPALQQFLTQHPEIPRDPRFYLADWVDSAYAFQRQPTDPAVQAAQFAMSNWRNLMESVLFFCGFVVFTTALGWLVKYIVDHRRWLRASKIQSETHAKILERFTSSEDLRAYMESPAGQSFLKATPLATAPAGGSAAPVGAPFNRILWSVQVGVVAGAVGIGLLVISWRQEYVDVAQMIGAWGTLAIALGLGFAISAVASYVISQRLGLLDQNRDTRQA